MHINSNIGYVSFKSHSKEVRDADLIMRRVKKTFPMVSSTRVTAFYDTLHDNPNPKFNDKLDKMQQIIYQMRDSATEKQKVNGYAGNPYIAHIEGIQKTGLGNCYEAAVAVAAGLCANGYNSDVATLYVTHTFTDKKTKQTEYRDGAYLDHAFAVTDMGKSTRDLDRQIVLDPWFGICGEWGEINSKYHALFAHDCDLKQFIENDRAEFKSRLAAEYPDKNISDYEERIGFIYRPIEIGKTNREKARKCIREKFPQLILNA